MFYHFPKIKCCQMKNTMDAHAEHMGTWQGDTGARSCRFEVSLPEAFLGFRNIQYLETSREESLLLGIAAFP